MREYGGTPSRILSATPPAHIGASGGPPYHPVPTLLASPLPATEAPTEAPETIKDPPPPSTPLIPLLFPNIPSVHLLPLPLLRLLDAPHDKWSTEAGADPSSHRQVHSQHAHRTWTPVLLGVFGPEGPQTGTRFICAADGLESEEYPLGTSTFCFQRLPGGDFVGGDHDGVRRGIVWEIIFVVEAVVQCNEASQPVCFWLGVGDLVRASMSVQTQNSYLGRIKSHGRNPRKPQRWKWFG
jgi:hypothetical protein